MEAHHEIGCGAPVLRPSPTTNRARCTLPVAYLTMGLFAMATLIVVAVIILVCSFRKPSFQEKAVEEACETEIEPKVVVIMAGDDKPTFLAQPHLLRAPPSAL